MVDQEFQKIKYDDPDAYANLEGFYQYKYDVPEATREDFAAYNVLKELDLLEKLSLTMKKFMILVRLLALVKKVFKQLYKLNVKSLAALTKLNYFNQI